MKKVTTIATIAVLILAVLFSMLPSSAALAKRAPDDVTVTVKNRTGGSVTVRLSGAGGSYAFTYEPGMYEFSVPEGTYSFNAVTPCGNESGQLNLNVHKILFLSCKNGGEMSLTRPENLPSVPACAVYGWWYTISDNPDFGGAWVPVPGWQPGDPKPDTAVVEQRCTDGDPDYALIGTDS